MNEQDLQKEIQRKVLDKVRSGVLHVHPRMYFVARLLGAVALALLALLVSALVFSFIIFSIHQSGQQFLLGFGLRGVRVFFGLFPWFLFGIDVLILIVLEWLLQGFKFGYRVSLLNVFLAIFGASALVAALIALTPLHGALLQRADRGELPVLGGVYEHVRDSHQEQGIFRGTVVGVQGTQITISHNDQDHDADDGTRTVLVPPSSAASISIGDRVYVLGVASGTAIEASGIEKLAPEQ